MAKRALVVGLGIAGMAAAIGMRRAGWEAVVIERSPERRTGGYFIGLFPEGLQAAAGLEIDTYLHTRNPVGGGDTWSLSRRGKRERALGFLDQPGRPAAVLRGDIEEALWQSVVGAGEEGHRIEVRLGTVPVEITGSGTGVDVLLEKPGGGGRYRETFDLVVGADGLRSTVRRLAFGPHEDYMTKWGAMICAFEMQQQVPSFEAQDSVISARAGRAAWVFGFADRPPTALLTYRTDDIEAQFTGTPVERIGEAFTGMDDPVVRHALDSLQQAPEFLFDSVHQVKMPRWSKGRVVLLGDAAWCLNLYSGMGATASLHGGAELGTALREHPDDPDAALSAWEDGLRPFITKNQRVARLKQQMFVPSGRLAEGMRSGLLRVALNVRRRKAARAAEPRVGNDEQPGTTRQEAA
ncbi:FAD-dependent monooxygenase [Streptomyces xinghaiensis]|uniref:FAD-dependent monooxygenase n=1 Tax=Streptomyces xinghaiensis TaxID=1038928 RepID=UPI0006855886|nr:FAD-dependent monooxygenase [Streptomyces xinghaiensis]MZE80615.1 oxidoreductase [Streptomyces sp. SID5475]